jgi:hypothetical protein
MNILPTQEITAATLMATNTAMPEERALAKAASAGTGLALIIIGIVLVLVAAALVVVPILVLRESPGGLFLIFAGVLLLGGFFLAFAGGHVWSGEAMTAAANSGSLLAKAVGGTVAKIRGKTS